VPLNWQSPENLAEVKQNLHEEYVALLAVMIVGLLVRQDLKPPLNQESPWTNFKD
jgi:hypothetical protein